MEYFDDLEIRHPEVRQKAIFDALPKQIKNAKNNASGWSKILSEVIPEEITSWEALAKLPITRKSELTSSQENAPPLGGLTTSSIAELSWIFCSPGPIYEPGTRDKDFWRMGRALYAAGFRKGDVIHNTFSYHLTPAGHMMEAGAHACNCLVVPGGIGNTEQQLQAITHIRPKGYVGTPSFLKILLEKGKELSIDVSSVTNAAVGGEALPPSLREYFHSYGIDVLQSYGTADLGLVAYESPATEGMIIDEGVVVEIVRPGTGTPLQDGEVGEVIVTSLNPVYPLIRFATGDLSAILSGQSACGRTNKRIQGWMGRADQTTKIKGMFVHPKQVADVISRHHEIGRARLVVDSINHVDVMTLHCEVSVNNDQLREAIVGSLQTVCKLKGDVFLSEPGTLVNDGKVIDDIRTYE